MFSPYVIIWQVDRMLDTLRWPLEFIMRAHTGKHELWYQVREQSTTSMNLPPPFYTTQLYTTLMLATRPLHTNPMLSNLHAQCWPS